MAFPMTSVPAVNPRRLPPSLSGKQVAALVVRLYSAIPSLATRLAWYNLVAVAAAVFGGPTAVYATLVPYALSMLYMTLRQPYTALVILFAYSATEGLYKYSSGFSNVVYAVFPVVLAVILLGWQMSRRQGGGQSSAPPAGAALIAFGVIAFLQSFNPAGDGPVSGMATAFLWYVGPLLMYFVAYSTAKSSRDVLKFVYVALLAGAVVSAVTLFQFSMGESWTKSHFHGIENTLQAYGASYRPPSTTALGGGGSGFARLSAILCMGMILSPVVSLGRKRLLVVLLALDGLAMLLSGVRVMLLVSMFEIGLCFALVARSPQQLVRPLLIAAVIGLFSFFIADRITGGAISTRYASTLANPFEKYSQERGYNLVGFWRFAGDHPMGTGYHRGLSNWTQANQNQIASLGIDLTASTKDDNYGALRDTQFGSLVQDIGLPGLLAFIGGIGALLYQGYRAFRRLTTPQLRIIGAMLLASLVGYVPGFFAGPLIQAALYFWVAAGILMALPKIEEREKAALAAVSGAGNDSEAGGKTAPAVRPLSRSAERRLAREALARAGSGVAPSHPAEQGGAA